MAKSNSEKRKKKKDKYKSKKENPYKKGGRQRTQNTSSTNK